MNYQDLKKPFFVLAPMDDVTDTVFRQIITDTAKPDLFFTEFVNVDGLQSPGREKLMPKLKFTRREGPIIAQVWGKHPENYYKTAKDLVEMGYDGVDINMGCPAKAVVQNGCCSALINNRELAGEIIKATREGLEDAAREKGTTPLPLSVKCRLGLKEIDLSWHEFLLQQKLNMLTIHGRTVKEMSEAPVHWDKINEIREIRDKLSPATLIVGNGDIDTYAEGLEVADKYKLDGVMIGRGVFHDPFVFSKQSPWETWTKEQKVELYRKHVELFLDTWQKGERKLHTLNKFCKIYVSGFDGAKEMREQLMEAEAPEQILNLLSIS